MKNSFYFVSETAVTVQVHSTPHHCDSAMPFLQGVLLMSLYKFSDLVATRLSLYKVLVHSVYFVFWMCSRELLQSFPAALLDILRLVRRLQYQFAMSWNEPTKGRTLDLPAPKWTHLPLDHGLVP